MKRKTIFVLAFLICGAMLIFAFIPYNTIMTPSPAPQETIYKFQADTMDSGSEYYDIKFSVYHISHDGYCCFNEGPFYPDEENDEWTSFPSQWRLTYSESTYATIWVKEDSYSSWEELADMNMDWWNTTKFPGTNDVQYFTIDMDNIVNPN